MKALQMYICVFLVPLVQLDTTHNKMNIYGRQYCMYVKK